MADNDSADNPVTDESQKPGDSAATKPADGDKLAQTFGGEAEGRDEPAEKPADETAKEEAGEKPEPGVSEEFTEKAQEDTATPDAAAGNDDKAPIVESTTIIDENGETQVTPKRGYTRNAIGEITWAGLPSMEMTDGLGKLLYLLSLLFKDPEMFPFMVDTLFPKEVYKDPVDRQRRVERLEKAVKDPADPLRQKPLGEFIESIFGDDKVRALLNHIAKYEAVNGSYDSVWPNSIHEGLTDKTINEVIEWQENRGKASNAAGRYQFIPSTLRGLVRNLPEIDGTEKFSPEMQDKLAIALLEEKGLSEVIAGNKSVDSFVDGIAQVWQAFKNTDGVGAIDNELGKASVGADKTRDVVAPLFGSGKTP